MAPRFQAALHQLQAVETRLRSLKSTRARKQRQLEQQGLRIKQLEEQLTTRKEEIRHRQSITNQLELEFKAREAAINKLRTQLNTAKSNKEYSAILTQLNTERASNSKLEERILQELTQIDEMKASHVEMETELGTQRQRLADQEAEFQHEDAQLQEQIEQLEQDRSRVAEQVPPSNLAIFQRVADSTDGEATAEIIKPNPKQEEYICGGCNMTIPVEKVNALLTKDDLQQCNICGRILYLKEQIEKGT